MIYLKTFKLLTEQQEWGEFVGHPSGRGRLRSHTEDEYYPYGIFHQFERIDFENVTVFSGGNGSGKTTLLNIIADKLELYRFALSPQTAGFRYYIEGCEYSVRKPIPIRSKFLASDDVFNHILSVREENKKIQSGKQEARGFYNEIHDPQYPMRYRDIFPDGVKIDFESDDYKAERKKLSRFNDARKKSGKQFVRSRAGEMQRQYSNGENALMFFDKQIEDNALYLLDEPENSLSPKFQIELKYLLEDSVRYRNCQFVIATHSPFMLSLRDTKIYNLDDMPVSVEKWYELENVKLMYELFKENEAYFVK